MVKGLSDCKDATTWIKDHGNALEDLSETQLSSFWLKKKEGRPNALVIKVGDDKCREFLPNQSGAKLNGQMSTLVFT